MIVVEADGPRREVTAAVTAGGRLVDLRISPYAMERDPRQLADEILRVINDATVQANAAARRAVDDEVPGASADEHHAIGVADPAGQSP